MWNLFRTGLLALRRQGFVGTIRRLPITLEAIRRERELRGLIKKEISVEERFTWIYTSNHWMNAESKSGGGSTLKYTRNLRAALPEIMKNFEISSVFDAPCGDFNWMSHVLAGSSIDYTGADIVKPLIEKLQSEFGGPRVRFVHMDLIRDNHPEVDLVICRDFLFHLSTADAFSVLERFLESGSRYLLTTTHAFGNGEFNRDIETGDFRLLDLFAPPFELPRDYLLAVEDFTPPDPRRLMVLWTREQIRARLIAGRVKK